jgi:hypothetical protein
VLPVPQRLARITVTVQVDAPDGGAAPPPQAEWAGSASAATAAMTDPFDAEALTSEVVYITAEAAAATAAGGLGDTAMADAPGKTGAGGCQLSCVQAGGVLWTSHVTGGVSALLAAPAPVCEAAGLPPLLLVGRFDGCVQLLDAASGAALSAAFMLGGGAVTHLALQVCAPRSAGAAGGEYIGRGPPVARLTAVSCDGQLRQWCMYVAAGQSAAPSAAQAPPIKLQASADVTASVASLVSTHAAGAGAATQADRPTLSRISICSDGSPAAQLTSMARAAAAPVTATTAVVRPFGFGQRGVAGGAARPLVQSVVYVWERDAACWVQA